MASGLHSCHLHRIRAARGGARIALRRNQHILWNIISQRLKTPKLGILQVATRLPLADRSEHDHAVA
jgi:hypothetical protein